MAMMPLAVAGLSASPAELNAQQTAAHSEVTIKVQRDGALLVTEKITVPAGGNANRAADLHMATTGDVDRVFTVRDITFQGNGSAAVSGDAFTVHAGAGVSTLTYTVGGAVVGFADHEEVRWPVESGWDVAMSPVSLSFSAPKPPQSITCLAGAVGSSQQCSMAQISENQTIDAMQDSLAAGDRMDMVISLPSGTVPINAKFDQTNTLATAFALTPIAVAGLVGLILLLLVGLAVLRYLRSRDTKALSNNVELVDVLAKNEQGQVVFVSPDGVLPGQIGTVIDEHVDAIDITATIIDLAVRNYLRIEEVHDTNGVLDWRIMRGHLVDAALTDYEKAVYEALLPPGVDQVRISELRGKHIDFTHARNALYQNVVDKQWFTRRPDVERNRGWWAGVSLVLLGIATTVVLALTIGHALIGLCLSIAGAALTVAAQWTPARTRRGSALMRQIGGLSAYLTSTNPGDIPMADREMVFSRSLPFAAVLGHAQHWLDLFRSLDPDADGTPGLYWFGEAEHATDLARFADRFPAFLSALDGVLARSGRLRPSAQR